MDMRTTYKSALRLLGAAAGRQGRVFRSDATRAEVLQFVGWEGARADVLATRRDGGARVPRLLPGPQRQLQDDLRDWCVVPPPPLWIVSSKKFKAQHRVRVLTPSNEPCRDTVHRTVWCRGTGTEGTC